MVDLIVIGAGAIGSATAFQAARAGASVLLLEQYAIDHQRGSSHGGSRIIRYVYDHPIYVRLARASFAAWRDLEAETGETFYIRTGGIDFAPPDEPLFTLMRQTLTATGIPHELWSSAETMQRFPQFHLEQDTQVLYQADTGILRASKAVRAFVRLAQTGGVMVKENSPVTNIAVHPDSVTVTAGGEQFEGARLVLAAGGWMSQWLEPMGISLPLQPVAAQENYFDVKSSEAFTPERFPVWMGHLQHHYGEILYGMPDIDGYGIKIGRHGGPPMDPDSSDRTPDAQLMATLNAFARQYFPDAQATPKSSRACIYTNTPDGHFVIDTHPEHAHVTITSCCSGHGFKFSPALGQIISNLALTGKHDPDNKLFRMDRFSTAIL